MLGITLYPRGVSYANFAQIAKRAEETGFDGIYFVESRGNNDALAAAHVAATATSSITVGTNIANVYMRHSSHLAAQAIAVDEISSGRLVLGIGASHRRHIEQLGMPWRPAVAFLAETPRVLRAAFTGVASDGYGSPLGRSAQHPIPIHWAGVSTSTIAAAGRESDGLMMFLATVKSVSAARQQFQASAREAGRSLERRPVSLLTPVFLCEDLEAAYEAARRYLAFYATMPVYQKIFAESGFEAEVAAIRAEEISDSAAVARHLSHALLDSIVLVGSAARCRDHLAAFTDAGIDAPLLAPQAVEGTAQDAAAALIAAFARA